MRKLLAAVLLLISASSPAWASSSAEPVQLGFLSNTTTGTAGCSTLHLGNPPCFVPYSATNPIAISGGGGGGTGTVTSLTAGTGLSSSPATITTTGSYSLLNATTTTLGGVIVGNGLAVSTTGVVSASGSSSLSALTSGTATNTIDNTLFAQTWTWNSLSTQKALSFTSSTLTTGTVLNLSAPNATTGQALTLSPALNVNSGGTGTPFGALAPLTNGIVNLIIDTDAGGDSDDLASLNLAFALQDNHEVNVLAIVSDVANTNSAAAAQTDSYFYGYPNIPVGRCVNHTHNCVSEATHAEGDVLAVDWTNGLANSVSNLAPDEIPMLRCTLAGMPDGSVTYYNEGPLTTLYNLYNSPADAAGGCSPLTGAQLIAKKIGLLMIWGGEYPSGTEFDFAQDPSSTGVINSLSTTPIIFGGFTVGQSVGTNVPGFLSPLHTAGASSGSWGPMGALYSIRGLSNGGNTYFALNGPGTNAINTSTGANTFTSGGGGVQYYLTLGETTTAFGTQMNALISKYPANNVGTSVNASTSLPGYMMAGLNALSYPLSDSTTGASIAIGPSALAKQTTSAAYGNVAIGYQALSGNLTTAGIKNTAVGLQAGIVNTSGNENTFIGWQAGVSNTSGQLNTFIGAIAGPGVTSAQNDTAIGPGALFNGGTGGSNTAVGVGAMAGGGTITGANNSGIGVHALESIVGGSRNVALGEQAGNVISSGTNNTVIGYQVGNATLTIGSDNILIGVSAALDAATSSESNSIHIGGTGGDWMHVTGTNTASTASATMNGLQLLPNLPSDATKTDATVCEDTTTHQLYFGSGTAGVCLGTSSRRYKHNITPVIDGIAQIEKLKPVNFYYNKEYGDPTQVQYGLIAEEVEPVLPKLVRLDKEGRPNNIDYTGMIPVLIKALQEQQEEIDSLKAQAKRHK